MSRIKVGQRIPLGHSHNSAFIIIFVSRFCSKCLYSKKVLNEILRKEEIKIPLVEIDIAYPHPLIDFFMPQSIPTVVLVSKDNQVKALIPQQISPRIARALAQLIASMS